MAEANDAGIPTDGFLEGLAEHNSHIFHGVVLVDVKIALRFDVDIHGGVLGEAFEHVVEEADTGGNRRLSRAIDVQDDLDLGLLGRADNFRLA